MALFGAHVSSSGSILKTFDRAMEICAETFQFFLRSPRSWRWRLPDDETVRSFYNRLDEFGGPVIVHAPYLLNPATDDLYLRQKTVEVMIEEFSFCNEAGIHYYNFHPGTAKGTPERKALENVKSTIEEVLSRVDEKGTVLLIENTAGQRGDIGKNLKELENLVKGFDGRVGICLDTCHLFASGYDISDTEGFRRFEEELIERGLLEKVKIIHANDSKVPLGGRKDRHEHIGKGFIGIEGFQNMLSHRVLGNLPYIIETPKEGDMDRVNLSLLREIKGSGDL